MRLAECARPRAQQRQPTQPQYIFNHSLCPVAVAGDGHTPFVQKTNSGVRVESGTRIRFPAFRVIFCVSWFQNLFRVMESQRARWFWEASATRRSTIPW